MSDPTTIIRVYDQDGDWVTAKLRGALPDLAADQAFSAWLDHHMHDPTTDRYGLRDWLRGAVRIELETSDDMGPVRRSSTLTPDQRDQAVGLVNSMLSMAAGDDPDPAGEGLLDDDPDNSPYDAHGNLVRGDFEDPDDDEPF